MEPDNFIYWERQVARHCGVHCINSLLQGPFYKSQELAYIAEDLDFKEKHLLQGQDIPSSNVDVDGNYSVQVLIEALKKIGEGLLIEAAFSVPDLSNVHAFICHSSAHWFSIRKIRGVWYNLNSVLGNMPQLVTPEELENFLQKNKKNSECKVFAVLGELPKKTKADFGHYMSNQMWISEQAIKDHHHEIVNSDNAGLHGLYIYNITEDEMLHLLKLSLGYDPGVPASAKGMSQDEMIAYAIKSAAAGEMKKTAAGPAPQIVKPSEPEQSDAPPKSEESAAPIYPPPYDKFYLVSIGADPDMLMITRQSLEQSFKHQPDGSQPINFILPNKQAIMHRFQPTSKIQTLYDFIFLDATSKWPETVYKYCLKHNQLLLKDMNLPIASLSDAIGSVPITIQVIKI